jgi:hypothetical protein
MHENSIALFSNGIRRWCVTARHGAPGRRSGWASWVGGMMISREPLHHGESDGVFIAAAVRAAQLGIQLGEEGVELPLSFPDCVCGISVARVRHLR